MNDTVNVRKIGNSLGVILPKHELDALDIGEGDTMFMLRTPDGIRLTPYDPGFAKVIRKNREYMSKHRDALRELAK